jgi:hypothetical protein
MPFILAIDYDDTLFEGSFHTKGKPKTEVIKQAKRFKSFGAEVVLWTCRDAGYLQEAIQRCKKQGLKFDAFNSNPPSQIKYLHKQLEKGNVFALRKIYADLYVDDKSPGSIEYFLKADPKKLCEKFANR